MIPIADSHYIQFSRLSGNHLYAFPAGYTGDTHILVQHVLSGEKYRMVPLCRNTESILDSEADWFRGFVLKPVMSEYFEWPVDLVEIRISEQDYVLCYAFIPHSYHGFEPIRNLLYQEIASKVLDWRNPLIQRVLHGFLSALSLLDREEYAYHDFDMNRIIFHPQSGKVAFLFTPQIRNLNSHTKYDRIAVKDISPVFAPPYLYSRDIQETELDENDDYYQITSMLFRMMIGRLPYEGRDLLNYGSILNPMVDTDEKAYFRYYHRYPHFIFDSKDESNMLSPGWENTLPRERWGALPPDIRKMFQKALCQRSAESPVLMAAPSPADWMEALTKLFAGGNQEGRNGGNG